MNNRHAAIDRQLQITINALARSLRKVLRHAEKVDPTGMDPVWQCVYDRSRMFHDMLAGTIAFHRATAEKPEEPALAADPTVEEPAATTSEAMEESAVPSPAPEFRPKLVFSPPAHPPARPPGNRQQRRAAQRRESSGLRRVG